METINATQIRVGNITSSEGACAIMSQGKTKGSFGKPALTYIEECNFERRLQRSITTESNARPLSWGHLVETRVFGLLGIEYKLVSKDTLVHPTINYWAGSPDAEKFDLGKTVIDIKSPITLKSFCQLVAPLYLETPLTGIYAMNMIRNDHKDGEKYYWQLVSNAILTNSKYAELIVYVPYLSELQDIKEMAIPSGDSPHAANWIYYAENEELPYLPDGGYYKNINIIRFEVPQEDKDALTDRVKECKDLLIKI